MLHVTTLSVLFVTFYIAFTLFKHGSLKPSRGQNQLLPRFPINVVNITM